MKFTHRLDVHFGWVRTKMTPSDYKEVKHLSTCQFNGDMFAAYDKDETIEIFKGTMGKETLKTNTWYKFSSTHALVYRTGDKNNYGIIYGGEVYNHHCTMPEVWTEATDEEVAEVLIRLAKKKGFKDIDKLILKNFDGKVYGTWMFGPVNNTYLYSNGELSLDGVVIFKNGKWVEILEDEPSLEDRITNLEKKIEQDGVKLDKIINMVEYNNIKK